MVASPLVATVVTAILRCDFCTAKLRTHKLKEGISPLRWLGWASGWTLTFLSTLKKDGLARHSLRMCLCNRLGCFKLLEVQGGGVCEVNGEKWGWGERSEGLREIGFVLVSLSRAHARGGCTLREACFCLRWPYKARSEDPLLRTLLRSPPLAKFSTTINQKYPQYCWEFHDRLWEALSGTNSEKRGAPSRTGGETILEMLWKPQMPWIIGFGASQPYSQREFQEKLWERFRCLSGIFPEFLPEIPSRTGGVA